MDNNNRTYYSHKAELRSGRKNAAMLVLALGVGAAAGLMFAPKTGHKTRQDLTHGLELGVKKLEEKVEEARKA